MSIRSCPIVVLLRELVRYIGASPQSRWHQLEALRDLDDRLLRDIGISRAQAMRGRPCDSQGDIRPEAWALYDSGIGRGV